MREGTKFEKIARRGTKGRTGEDYRPRRASAAKYFSADEFAGGNWGEKGKKKGKRNKKENALEVFVRFAGIRLE